MNRRQANTAILAAAATPAAPGKAAQALEQIALSPPRSAGGKPLTEALKARHSTREYSNRRLPPQMLSDLLWAAFGVNPLNGDRTAPYWRPPSSGKTSAFSVPPRNWPRSFAERLMPQNSGARSGYRTRSSSPSPKRWDMRECERPSSTLQIQRIKDRGWAPNPVDRSR
jgi:hypothetical protein